MTIYIHFGIYKAGSSYLQYICANNTTYLLQQGIYFPPSSADSKMLRGEISPGNALVLEQALKSANMEKLEQIVTTWKKGAELAHCKSVLISAEALVHQLAIPERLTLMLSTLKQVGFTDVHALGFFRDLAEHALSTYKHRAKSGKIPDYVAWLKNTYETPALLQRLVGIRQGEYDIHWTFRKFFKDGGKMKSAFFEDWLKINTPDFKGTSYVNESVTLSEVMVMNNVRNVYLDVADIFVQKFKAIPGTLKAGKADEDRQFKFKAAHIFIEKKVSLEILNNYFPDQEKLEIGIVNEGSNMTNDSAVIHLSPVQLNTLIETMRELHTIKGYALRMGRKMKRLVPSFLLRRFVSGAGKS